MRAQLRRLGNSSGVIIPKAVLAQLGVRDGDSLDLAVEAGRLVLAPVPAHPRAGWAEDAKRIAAAGDEAPEWRAFGSEGDAQLEW